MNTQDFLYKIVDALDAIAQMHAGSTSPQTVADAIADLRTDLNNTYPDHVS